MSVSLQPGKLVSLRGREWVVLPSDDPDLLVVKPLGGSDDEIAGIKSSARYFGERVRAGIATCYALTILLIGAALVLADSGPLAFIGLLAFAVHLLWQVMSVHANDPAGALRLFRSNRDAGLLFFAGLLLDALLR